MKNMRSLYFVVMALIVNLLSPIHLVAEQRVLQDQPVGRQQLIKSERDSRRKQVKGPLDQITGGIGNRAYKKIIQEEMSAGKGMKLKREAQEYLEEGLAAKAAKQWNRAIILLTIASQYFPDTHQGKEALFHKGDAYYQKGDLDFANQFLSEYLRRQEDPEHFEEAITYKYLIAEQLRDGEKIHLFGSKRFPKWSCGKTIALEIFDEIIAAVPTHEFAAQSLFAKGQLLRELGEYRQSIEAHSSLVRQFPKHELAPEGYLEIAKVYLKLAYEEQQNPEVIALALLNVRNFEDAFPKESRIEEAKQCVLLIEENYASGLFETGKFYERTSHPEASILYYKKAMKQFPHTQVAVQCEKRLEALQAIL